MTNPITQKISPGWLVLLLNLVALTALGLLTWHDLGLTDELAASRQALHTAENETRTGESLAKLLADTTAARETLAQSLVTPDNLPDFIDQLEALAGASGAKLDLQTAVPATASNANLKLDFTATGSFGAVWRFAERLDYWPKQIRPSVVDFTRQAGADSQATAVWQSHWTIQLPQINQTK